MPALPQPACRGLHAVVATADAVATDAGMAAFHAGGNAVDAAVGAAAAIAVTGPHLCGMGGDLFALVHHDGRVHALNASGRAGSGSDPEQLRRDGATMPFHHDIRSVTVPGCVDGWLALHRRFGRLPIADVLAPAIALAELGFPASPLLVGSLKVLDEAARAAFAPLAAEATITGARTTRSGVARALRAIADGGREGFYLGEFGRGLVAMSSGHFAESDLARQQADWQAPLTSRAFGVDLHTVGPNSQGYLALGGALLADAVGLPDDPDDPLWVHLLVECATAVAHDRPDRLHDGADGPALVAEVAARAALVDLHRRSARPAPATAGDTTYLCTADDEGTAVSLIQSNASGFGSLLVEASTGINLHNRGIGFDLRPGHPAAPLPGHRPPHTLVPMLATDGDGLRAVFGSMGGDAQPQIVLQLAARLFGHHESPVRAVGAPRWVLRGESGFSTWTSDRPPALVIDESMVGWWRDELVRRGHEVVLTNGLDPGFGHAHAIVVEATGALSAAADPRTRVGAASAR
jgi:gamma-glutamyltranspeptidase / glutathione hydrolase